MELFLNGDSLGVKTLTDAEGCRAVWTVPYAPGTLRAVIPGGEDSLCSTGPGATLALHPDVTVLAANGTDVAQVEVSLLDALRSPIFMKYYEAQPFNTNHLRPCPMLENPDDLPKMVAETGAHCTDLVEKETPEQLREKTAPAAAAWKPVAERLWADEADPDHVKRLNWREGQAETDVTRLARVGRDLTTQAEPRL